MTYAAAKAEIVTILEAIVVTDPTNENETEVAVGHVYPLPPDKIEETLAFVLYPPSLIVERANSLRVKSYGQRIRFLVRDEVWATAAGWLDAFREALIDAFDTAVALNQASGIGVAQIVGPTIDEAASFEYGDTPFLGFDANLAIIMREGATFSP